MSYIFACQKQEIFLKSFKNIGKQILLFKQCLVMFACLVKPSDMKRKAKMFFEHCLVIWPDHYP